MLRLGIRSLGLVVQILVEPTRADVDRSGVIETPESVALGLALGLDSLGAGFGAAMGGETLGKDCPPHTLNTPPIGSGFPARPRVRYHGRVGADGGIEVPVWFRHPTGRA